jgi:hypothetical protein
LGIIPDPSAHKAAPDIRVNGSKRGQSGWAVKVRHANIHEHGLDRIPVISVDFNGLLAGIGGPDDKSVKTEASLQKAKHTWLIIDN